MAQVLLGRAGAFSVPVNVAPSPFSTPGVKTWVRCLAGAQAINSLVLTSPEHAPERLQGELWTWLWGIPSSPGMEVDARGGN